MPGHSIEPYIVGLGVPTLVVLMGLGWSKLTSRRNRPIEPTLWFVARWTFILLLLSEIPIANGDYLIGLHRRHPGFFAIVTVTSVFAVFTPAVFDWRRAVRKERRQVEQDQIKAEDHQ
jgi:hypothetical protein